MSIRPLPPDLQDIARTQIHEDPKRIQKDIEYIKEWLKKQPHLNVRQDDQWILSFIRGCKFSLEKTKEKLDMFYSMRTLLPEFFKGRDIMDPVMQDLLQMGIMTPLGHDKKGRRVVLARYANFDYKKVKFVDMIKFNFMNMDVTLKDCDRYVIAGEIVICDMKGLSLEMLTMITPSLMKKSMTVFQEAYPCRPQGAHYINVPSAMESFFNFMKSFMKKKLQDRMYFHKDMKSLFEHVSQDILPNEYGGSAGPFEELTEKWRAQVESNRDWLIEDEQYGSDESKREGKPKTSTDLFGMEGSFRSLSVD